MLLTLYFLYTTATNKSLPYNDQRLLFIGNKIFLQTSLCVVVRRKINIDIDVLYENL